MLAVVLIVALSGCEREATIVSRNVSKEADNFNVCREIIVLNVRSNTVLYTLRGYFSLSNEGHNELCVISEDEITPKLKKLKEELAMFKDKIDTQPPFGSIGDSVDLEDEWRKQHSSTTTVTTTTGPINQQCCGQRLPCGICRMTMMQCPMQVQRYEVTYSSQTETKGATVK